MRSILDIYQSIGLEEMTEKALLGRIDTKYIIKASDVDHILQHAIQDYEVLEISGKRSTGYETIYYDNPDMDLYHHARLKRPNRFKLRYRQYKINGQEFFELKKKIRGTSTLKERIALQTGKDYGSQIASFLVQHNIEDDGYIRTLQVLYDRICLVSKISNERVTIDTNIRVNNFKNDYQFRGLAIIEIKSKKSANKNIITSTLKSMGYRPSSSSKYCLGLAFADPQLNRSGFAPQIKIINNILQ